MKRGWGFVPVALLAVAIPATIAFALAQSAPDGPWEGNRSDLSATHVTSAAPVLGCEPGEPMESSIFDYLAPIRPDELNPIERAHSIAAVDADPAVDLDSAQWVDLSQTQGAVTFVDADEQTVVIVRFDLLPTGWLAGEMDRCVTT